MRIKTLTVSILFIFSTTHTTGQCDHPDYAALVAIYDALNGENWVRKGGWDKLKSGEICSPCNILDGVTDCCNLIQFIKCNKDGRVKSLEMNGNFLNGILPDEIGELTDLESLDLFNNQDLEGFIPNSIGNLSKLKSLELHSTSLRGEIPKSIGKLSKLEILNLGSCNLMGSIPDELFELNVLEELLLNGNSLDGQISSNISGLTSLKRLMISRNSFSGRLPGELLELGSLEVFSGDNNNFSGRLPEVNISESIYNIKLSSNNFSGCFPSSYSKICVIIHDFKRNPLLPFQGDYNEFCNGEDQIGAPCSDGNEINEKDVINPDCTCGVQCPDDDIDISSTVMHPQCASSSDGSITLVHSQNLNFDWSTGTTSNELAQLSEGLYTVTISDELMCYERILSFTLVAMNQIGDSCDDGDVCTINDSRNENCECVGEFQDSDGDGICDADETDCVVGDSCDDNDLCTVDDAYDSDCECVGLFQDSDSDGICDAEESDCVIGIPCNDNDICTEDDVYDANCECTGIFQDSDSDGICDAEDETDGDCILNEPCDDNNSLTENDAYDSKCRCIGSVVIDTRCADLGNIHPDYAALMDFYNSTTGDNWTNNTGWKEGASGESCNPCDYEGEPWYGIICSNAGEPRVTHIDMDGKPNGLGDEVEGNNLVGTIPESIGQLSKLRVLRIFDDRVEGQIPASLGDIEYLSIIYLANNQLSGVIPENIAGLKTLKQIILKNNDLSGCISESFISLCDLTVSKGTRDNGYDLTGNPKMSWEGEFSLFCKGERIVGAPCNDGDANTVNDQLNENCECIGRPESGVIMLSNIVTPNGDGVEDYLQLMRGEKPIIGGVFKVYNRQGIEVYRSDHYSPEQWYGQDNNGEKLPNGVYFYTLRLDNNDIKKSSVTVLR